MSQNAQMDENPRGEGAKNKLGQGCLSYLSKNALLI